MALARAQYDGLRRNAILALGPARARRARGPARAAGPGPQPHRERCRALGARFFGNFRRHEPSAARPRGPGRAGARLPLLRRLRSPASTGWTAGGHAGRTGTTTASTSSPPGRSTCWASTSPPSPPPGRSPDRSWPASSSAGCPACSGSASAWSSSARCTTSRRWSPRSATTGAPSPRWCGRTSGQRAWLAIMAFIWVALVYVILAFTDVTASTFVSGDADLRGLDLPLQPRRRGGGGLAALPGPRRC